MERNQWGGNLTAIFSPRYSLVLMDGSYTGKRGLSSVLGSSISVARKWKNHWTRTTRRKRKWCTVEWKMNVAEVTYTNKTEVTLSLFRFLLLSSLLAMNYTSTVPFKVWTILGYEISQSLRDFHVQKILRGRYVGFHLTRRSKLKESLWKTFILFGILVDVEFVECRIQRFRLGL